MASPAFAPIYDPVTGRVVQRNIWGNVVRLPPTYGTPFGQYPPTEDVTFTADEPQTFAQTAGIDPLNEVLPYIDPNYQYQTSPEQVEAEYERTSALLDEMESKGELRSQPPIFKPGELDEIIRQMEEGPPPQPSPDAQRRLDEEQNRLDAEENARLSRSWQNNPVVKTSAGTLQGGGGGADTLAGTGGEDTLSRQGVTFIDRHTEAGSRNKPVSPVLVQAVSDTVERTYGPGYTIVLRSGAGPSKEGTVRHTPGRGGLPGAAGDWQILAPDGHQLAGAELDPLAKNWVGIQGSMGINHYPGEKGSNWTHLDLVGGIQPYSLPLKRGENVSWYYNHQDADSTYNREAQIQKVSGLVRGIQTKLAERGLYDDEIDGIVGPKTRAGMAQLSQMPDGQQVLAQLGVPQGSGNPVVPLDVRTVQTELANRGLYKGNIDGIWGPQTQTAMAAAGGFTSPGTAVAAAAPPAPIARSPPNPEDVKVALVALAEARGEGYEGLLAVTNVINNRKNDQTPKWERWGDTVDSVLRRSADGKGEFAPPIRPDQVSPDMLDLATNIAAGVRQGFLKDNTRGATFFYNPDRANPNLVRDINTDTGGQNRTQIAGMIYEGQGTYEDPKTATTAVAAAAPPPAPVPLPTGNAMAFAELPRETAAGSFLPASAVRGLPSTTPTATPAFAPITEARTKDDAYTPSSAAFAPITEARTKDDTTYPSAWRESVVQSVAGPAFAPVPKPAPAVAAGSPLPSRDVYARKYGTDQREIDADLAALKEPADWAKGIDQYRPMTAFAPPPTVSNVPADSPVTALPLTVEKTPPPPPVPVPDTNYPTPAIPAAEEKKDPFKGVGRTLAKGALSFFGGIPGMIINNVLFPGGSGGGSGGGFSGLFSGFGGPQVFKPGGPSGTTPNGWNYQTGTGIQNERSTQFSNNGRTYTYTDQSNWGQPSIGGWSK